MNITLSKVKFIEEMSTDTNCFSATVSINGVQQFIVSNNGQGGDDQQEPIVPGDVGYVKMRHGIKLIEDYAKSLPMEDVDGYKIQPTMDILIGDAFNAWLDEREKKKFGVKLQSKIMTQENGKCYSYRVPPGVDPVDPKYMDAFILRHPGIKILNLLPLDEAWKIVKGK